MAEWKVLTSDECLGTAHGYIPGRALEEKLNSMSRDGWQFFCVLQSQETRGALYVFERGATIRVSSTGV